MNHQSIACIGGGNMATSLIGGLIADGYPPSRIFVSEPDDDKRAALAARFGIRTVTDNLDAARQAEVLVLAVKPQIMQRVCAGLAAEVQQRRPLVISIAAGIREQALRAWLGEGTPLVRTMPNTPAMIQAGATVLHASPEVSEARKNLAESILRAVGLTCWVDDEGLLDAATALSGSGPAYFFLLMEILEEAGNAMGLAPDTARLLTIQTALGAARMAMESSDPPATLRRKVTSPGGTTERALTTLEDGGLRNLLHQALAAARDRSRELSQLLGED